MVELRDEFLPELSGVRGVLGSLPLLVLFPCRHLIQKGGEAVHVAEEVLVQLVPFGEGDDSPLRPPCDRAGPMESRERFRAAWKDELRDLAAVEGLARVPAPPDVAG